MHRKAEIALKKDSNRTSATFNTFPELAIALIILIALQEIVMAVWLIMKGLNPLAVNYERLESTTLKKGS